MHTQSLILFKQLAISFLLNTSNYDSDSSAFCYNNSLCLSLTPVWLGNTSLPGGTLTHLLAMPLHLRKQEQLNNCEHIICRTKKRSGQKLGEEQDVKNAVVLSSRTGEINGTSVKMQRNTTTTEEL